MNSKILGISASLRNARRGLGNVDLVNEIKSLDSEEKLHTFLRQEALAHLRQFETSGREENVPFDELYKNLKKLKGNKGLSNSEVALTSALWAAHQLKSDIDHVSLAEHFTESGDVKDIENLRSKILWADGILVSTPVYFGDRGSLAQTFLDFIRDDKELHDHLQGKVYAGCAVGAKRNGGQETALIYQLFDMIELGMLGVGNDSETTSQYGGTGHAGDVGTMPEDRYGLSTSMGTGRRIARVTNMMNMGKKYKMTKGLRVGFLVLQDKDNVAFNFVKDLMGQAHLDGTSRIIDVTEKNVKRCLACDICPTHVSVDEEYRCIIKAKSDDLPKLHDELLDLDYVVPVVYCPENRDGLKTNYQQFMERTRYLRRGDYVLSDSLGAPLVIEDLGATQNMQLRMMTSTLRHHTIMARPMTLYRQAGQFLNGEQVLGFFKDTLKHAEAVTCGRLAAYSEEVEHLKYNPVGYVLSTVKDKEDEKLKRREAMMDNRVDRAKVDFKERIGTKDLG